MQKNSQDRAVHVSVVSIIWNMVLFAFKLFAGIFARSGAMVSDAVHSASDVLSTFVVIAGVKMSGKSDDADHQYGHERMESVAAIILAVFLVLVGAGIGIDGVKKIFAAGSVPLEVPGALALVAAIVSIVVKEWMYWYTRSAAKKINSDALLADAWHHRSDALSSVGSFIGIGGAMLGFPILDPIASVVICLFVIKVGVSIFIGAINKMVDKACDAETVAQMKEIILHHEEVRGLDLLRTRMFGSRIYVDVEFSVDGGMSLKDAHTVAQAVHDEIESRFQSVKHCMVHVNPAE